MAVRRALGTAAALVAAGAVVACDAPPELRPTPPPTSPGPSATSPAPTPSISPLPLPTPTATGSPSPSFSDAIAVDCAGHPSAAQVIRLLRRTPGLIGYGARVTVHTGPLCAGTWQYTVLNVQSREPLAAVTEGRPSRLRLVTAGTDVCSIPVRTGAPQGIRTAAACQ